MTRSQFGKFAASVLLLIVCAITVTPSLAMQGDTIADRELGQIDFNHNTANQIGTQGFNAPSSVAVDASVTPNRLYVSDGTNSRVLGWKDVTSFVNGSPADIVVGQPDFVSGSCNNNGPITASSLCQPSGVAVDAAGNLYVVDVTNNRVLEYTTPFAACGSFPCVGGAASLVFGQGGSFTSGNGDNGGITANSLSFPNGVAVDASGDVYITDTGNSRVLEFNTPLTVTATPGSGDTTADLVFGQGGSFSSGDSNSGGLSAESLNFPFGIAVDGASNLYIADEGNNRVLEYNTPLTVSVTPGSGDTTADLVFGQAGSFTSSAPDNGGVSANSLSQPYGVSVDSAANVYIVEGDNARVLEYNTPLTASVTPGSGDTTADLVFGQGGSFTSAGCNSDDGGGEPSANDLCFPNGAAVDTSGNLYVADNNNNRVVEYNTPLTTDTTADVVLGQSDLSHNTVNFAIAANRFNQPYSVAIDTSSAPNRLYIADTNNSRVLGYKDVATWVNGGAADLVIGQADFVSGACNNNGPASASTLCMPFGVAVDTAGNLYVADSNNNRALEYAAPFAACASFPCVGAPASVVIGQAACETGTVGAGSLCGARSLAVDAAGNLYIADSGNNRVVEYNAPLTNASVANLVFGQGGSFTANACNTGGVSASSLCDPFGVSVDANGNVYVDDFSNNRALEYNKPLTTDTVADHVYGQNGSFTSNSPGGGASGLNFPAGITADRIGNIYIADDGGERVLEFSSPLTSSIANRVFGQGGDFNSESCNVGAGGLCHPFSSAVDSGNNLYIADRDNNRVLEFDNPNGVTTSLTVTASLVFGNVAVGQTVVRNVTVLNTGKTNALDITGATPSDNEYVVTNNGTCGAPPITLLPKKSCTLQVAFTPAAVGGHGATLTVTDNGGAGSQIVSLSGTGVVDVTTSKTSLVYGSLKFGTNTIAGFEVVNHETQPITLSENFNGTNSGDFRVDGGTCTATLKALSECSIYVAFTPGALGTESATLSVTASPDPLGPHLISLSTGATIPATVTPAKLAFGTLTVRTPSKTLNATVNNLSGFSLPVGESFSGSNAGDFAVTGGTCGASTPPSSTCTVAVTFTPTVHGAESASMKISLTGDPTSPHTITLSGTGP